MPVDLAAALKAARQQVLSVRPQSKTQVLAKRSLRRSLPLVPDDLQDLVLELACNGSADELSHMICSL